MNKKIFAILAVASLSLAALAGVASAGINPATYGLPNVTLAPTDNSFYSLTVASVPGARGSVMCVACHTRNPSARTDFATLNFPGTIAGARVNYMGSHWVTRTFADTSKGGGYTDGTSPKNVRRPTNVYFADNVGQNNAGGMLVANGWYARPKYGVLISGAPDNTYDSTVGTQLICESCHNIVKNIGPAKLIASAFANGATTSHAAKGTQDPDLCIGCHGNMNAGGATAVTGLSGEWQLHPLTGGAESWGGTQHHRNTSSHATPFYFGSATPIPNATHDMGLMARSYYGTGGVGGGQVISGARYQMWAAGAGTLVDHAVNSATTERLKGTALDNAQIGTSTNYLLCTNCHRAHNADGTAGGTILMRGSMAVATALGTGALPDLTTVNAPRGMFRMEDKGGRTSAFNSTNPNCLACHQ